MEVEERAKLLVVEDEAIIALDLRCLLEENGYEVVDCVVSGEAAVAAVEEFRPDLVLMDIKLQGEMDGLEAARRIFEARQTPSFFLTSHDDPELLQRAKAAQGAGYALKPFVERDLLIHLDMALHRLKTEKRLRQNADTLSGAKAAREREPLPLTIRTLGCFELSLAGKKVAGAEVLTPIMRDLLAMLLATPQQAMSREEMQAALWPESPSNKARASLDSLLLRLRRALAPSVQPVPIERYLVTRRGMVYLEECEIDLNRFRHFFQQGEEAHRHKVWDGAKKAFRQAQEIWQGDFLPEAGGGERVDQLRHELQLMLVEATLKLATLCERDGRPDEAISVLERSVSWQRGNDPLVRRLYLLLYREKLVGRARQVLQAYREALVTEGYPPGEINDILAEIALDESDF